MELPFAISIPSVVDYKTVRTHSIRPVQTVVPLLLHVNNLRRLHIACLVARSSIVTVDIQLVPTDIDRICTPGHGTLTLAVSQERTALLVLAVTRICTVCILSNQAHHCTYLPRLTILQRSIPAPASSDTNCIFGYYSTRLGSIDIYIQLAACINGLAHTIQHYTDCVRATFGSYKTINVLVMAVSRRTIVIIAGRYIIRRCDKHIHATNVQFMRSGRICQRYLHLLTLLQYHTRFPVLVNCTWLLPCRLLDTGRNLAVGHVRPCTGSQCNLGISGSQRVFVLVSCAITHSIVSHGILQTGKNLVGHQYGTARITHNLWSRACCLRINIVNHRDYIVHLHVTVTRQHHFSTKVMAAVTQHCLPCNTQLGRTVVKLVFSHQGLARKMLGTACCRCICLQVNHLQRLVLHRTGRNHRSRTYAYSEYLRSRHQVHSLRACKEQTVVLCQERSRQHIVVQRMHLTVHSRPCCTYSLLLLGI